MRAEIYSSINKAARRTKEISNILNIKIFLCVNYYGREHRPEFSIRAKHDVQNPNSRFVIGIYKKHKWIKGESRKQIVAMHQHHQQYNHLLEARL